MAVHRLYESELLDTGIQNGLHPQLYFRPLLQAIYYEMCQLVCSDPPLQLNFDVQFILGFFQISVQIRLIEEGIRVVSV